jgi:hypothetical protein
VDIDDAGAIIKRNGYNLAKAVASVTSAYSSQDQVGYVVANGDLGRVADDLSLITLAASTATEFTSAGGVLFTNDGLKVQSDIVVALKIPTPVIAPAMLAQVGGYPAGVYRAVYCYKAPSGLLGASSPPTSLTVAEGEAPTVLPPPAVAGYTTEVYMTDADGAVYYRGDGTQLPQFNILASPFFSGAAAMAVFNSCLYTAHWMANGSSLVRWSFEFHYHLYDSLARYVLVPGEVRAMASVANGLVIATDSAVFVLADPAPGQIALAKLADYGVPRGRAITRLPDGTLRLWTYRGVCEALPFKNLTEKKALFAPGNNCSTALVAQDGIQKFIALTDGEGAPYNSRF